MKIIAGGVDVGNSTTEVALAKVGSELEFIASGISSTTGIKGTVANIAGIKSALAAAVEKTIYKPEDISLILLNEATPVIADVAMETITETIINRINNNRA